MVSIIVPVYNAEKYLKRCLDSLLNQTYPDLEIVLVNDASTDHSLEICLEYQRKNTCITVHTMEKNGGQVSTYIKGIELSSGEWIGFVDSDDWIEPDMYERLIQAQKKFKSDIVACGTYVDFPSHTKVEPEGIEGFDNLVLTNEQIREEFVELRNKGNKINEVFKFYRTNKIFRRELVLENLKYVNKEIRVFEDNLFMIPCMLDAKSISYVGNPLYHYVRREDSTMGSFNPDILSKNRIFLDSLKRIYSEKDVKHDYLSDVYMTTTFSLYHILMANMAWKDKLQLLKQLNSDIEPYDLSFRKCRSWGASSKLAFMIQMLRLKRFAAMQFISFLYAKIEGSR